MLFTVRSREAPSRDAKWWSGRGACGLGLVSRASGGFGSHCPAQLRGSVRQRAGGADERRGEKPCGIRELSDCGSFRLQKAVPRSKENAAVERREARRSALWAGSSLPLEGQVRSQDGPTGAAFRAREFRRSASLFWDCEGFEH